MLYTPGKGTLADSLSAIFGKRFLTTLMPFDCKLHNTRDVSVLGYVSLNDSKACKTNASQQFTFLNGRPVDLPKLSRVINESYRQVNPVVGRHLSFPVFILHITIPPDMVDWNMSPDKRTVLFVDQDHILQTLKGWLCRRLDPDGERTFEMQILPPLKLPPPPPASSTPAVSRRSSMLENSMDVDGTSTSTTEHIEQRASSPVLIPSPPESARIAEERIDTDFHVQLISTQPTQPKRTQQKEIEEVDLTSFEPPTKKQVTTIIEDHDDHSDEFERRSPQVIAIDIEEPRAAPSTQLQQEVAMDTDSLQQPPDAPLASQSTQKVNSIDAILEKYQKQASDKKREEEALLQQQPRKQLINALDAFSVGSTQSRLPVLKDIISSQPQRSSQPIQQQPQRDVAQRSRTPIAIDFPEDPLSEDSFAEERRVEVKSEALTEYKGMAERNRPSGAPATSTSPSAFRSHSPHAGCGHGCSHEHSSSMDSTQEGRTQTAEVEMDLPSTFDVPVSQIVGATRPKLRFNMSQFAKRYRAREARLAQTAEQNAKFQTALNAFDAKKLNAGGPQKIGNRTVRKFSAISSYSLQSDMKVRDEMTRNVSKSDFADMVIIGQFNKAFIITKLDDELFILDQHACDEKYNFEALCKQKRIYIQKLHTPKTLELSPPEVDIVLSNMSEFTSRGFRLEAVEDATSAINRLRLTGFVDKKSSLSVEEQIQEIIEAAREGVAAVTRLPSEYRANATEACRMSIMFGKPLGLSKMRTVVKNMATMNQPWNCPHGRPTMRHLMSLVGKTGK